MKNITPQLTQQQIDEHRGERRLYLMMQIKTQAERLIERMENRVFNTVPSDPFNKLFQNIVRLKAEKGVSHKELVRLIGILEACGAQGSMPEIRQDSAKTIHIDGTLDIEELAKWLVW